MDDNFPTGLSFDDVLLEPRESHVSRASINLETNLTKKLKLNIPVISAAMDTVSETAMAVSLSRLGGMTVLHRNNSIKEQAAMVSKAKKQNARVAGAIGPGDLERARVLEKAGADAIVVDTAHAHNMRAVKSAKEIKRLVKCQVIVGNIATREAAIELCKFADAVKVGVGPGSICTTRVVAGIGVPQLTAILEVAKIANKKKVPVIADGGIKYSGDAVKALAAGASAVMLGGMLAGTAETPGQVIKIGGKQYKSYRGMGSLGVMQGGKSSDRYFQKHPPSNPTLTKGGNKGGYIPEGIEGAVSYKGPVKDVIEQITGGIKSGMGYIGAKNIPQMWKQARFIRITGAGLRESHPHSVVITKKAPNY